MKAIRLLLALAVAGTAAWAEMRTERLAEGEESSWLRNVAFAYDDAEGEAAVGELSLNLGNDPLGVKYYDVPLALWREFAAAESKGKFYGERIREKYERTYGPEREEMFDSPLPTEEKVDVSAAFNEECEGVVLRAIEQSRHSIYIAAYAFTRTRIAKALLEAHERGVRVELKMDADQAKHPGAERIIAMFQKAGIPVTIIHTHGDYAAMHNKFMVFDMRGVVTGSYNYTTQAQVVNWENLVWLRSDAVAELYKQAWDAIVSDEM
ncbi:MAG: KTSC domain-containing protein [Kiritimatiellae bacterium]|nr:KTSC domain-containing protein [Kiritimatiellia bacterium]